MPLLERRTKDPRPRPRFDLLVPLQPEAVWNRLHEAIETSAAMRGVALDRERFEIMRDDRSWYIWTPQLDVKLVEVAEGTKVMGRFGPHPNIWMAYLSAYMLTAFVSLGCIVWGAVQWMMDGDPWMLYLAPLSLLVAALVYGASYVGQGLATGHMFELREFLEESLEETLR